MIDFLKRANNTINSLEQSFVNLISSIVPWLAPIAPAIMTYQNLTNVLTFGEVGAIIVAVVVEFLGLSTVSTSITLWKHNQRYTDKKYHLPTWMPLLSFAFYIFLVVTLNVLIEFMSVDYPQYEAYTEIAARALLVFLTVPASAVLVSRSQYTRTVALIEKQRADAKAQREANKKQKLAQEKQEAERLAQEAKQAELEAKQSEQEKAKELHVCEYCGAEFETVQARSAHLRFCENYKCGIKQPSVSSLPSNQAQGDGETGEGRGENG